MLEITQAEKVFYRGQPDVIFILNGLSLELKAGDFSVVIGSNGAGKSSLLNAISGSMSLDSGKIAISGNDVTNSAVHLRAIFIARVFQDPVLGTASTMIVAENLLLADLRGPQSRLKNGLTSQRLKIYRDQIAVLGLGLEDRMDTSVALLSGGGQRQSSSLVMAVSGRPDVLLLDEHTAALDPRTTEIGMHATINAIGEFELSARMVTLNMQQAVEYANKVIMMDSGKVRIKISGSEKDNIGVADLIEPFTVESDQMLLAS